jgi:hypothetical protein
MFFPVLVRRLEFDDRTDETVARGRPATER